MPLFEQPKFVQKSPEWLAARHNFITASAADVINGRFPWQSARDLFWEKVNPFVPRLFSNPHMQRGVDNEDRVVRLYEERTGYKVMEFGMLVHHELFAALGPPCTAQEWMTAIVQGDTTVVPAALHQRLGFFAGSPDGITTCGRLLEVKCPRVIKPVVEPYYYAQCQLNMEVMNLDVCDLVKYSVDDDELWMTTFTRDRSWFAQWQPVAARFWQQVLAARADPTAIPPEYVLPSRKRGADDDDDSDGDVKRSVDEAKVLQFAAQPFNE